MITSLDTGYNADAVAQDILTMRDRGLSFQSSRNLRETIQDCVDFYEGRQWGKIGGKTKTLPRATFNQTEMIVNNKVAGILSTPLKVVYHSSEMPDKAQKLTSFHAAIEKEMDADSLYEEVVNKGAVEGSAFVHCYWDADAVGRKGEYKGGLRAELIESLCVTVHNPCESDIQRQKWVIVESREEVGAVRGMCEREGDRERIAANDNELMTGVDREQDESGLCTVFTRYFRKDGEVYFEKSAKDVLIHAARALNPELNLKKLERQETGAEEEEPERNTEDSDTGLQDKPEQAIETGYKASLYPIEVYQYKSRKNSIYGRGEVEPIIPNNRTINFNAAMMSKSVEDQGFGTIVAREGALGAGRTIPNDSSKILIDKYRGAGNGYYALNKTPFNAAAYQLNREIMETTRSVTGSTEVMTGEVLGKNQSGTSIAYLQQQAQKPIDKLAKRYRKFRERLARIEMQYYVLYYEDKPYETEIMPSELKERAAAAMQSGANLPPELLASIREPEKIKDVFNGKEYRDVDYDIAIEVGAASQYSEIAMIQMLSELLQGKAIGLRTFYRAYPDNLLPNKQMLLDDLDEQEQSQISVLTQQIEQLQAQVAKDEQIIRKQSEIVNNIMSTIRENDRLKAMLAQLRAEYTQKIQLANQTLAQYGQELMTEQAAAQAMADIIHAGTAQKSNTNAGNA